MKKYLFAVFLSILSASIALGKSSGGSSSSYHSSPSVRPGSGSSSSTPSVRPSNSSSSSSTPSVRPGSNSSGGNGNSARPTNSNFDSGAATAKQRTDGSAAYQRANPPPPRPAYTASNGQSVRIDPSSSHTQYVRNLPPDEVRYHAQRVDVYHHNLYGARWDYYKSQPIVVIGPYSSPFWYSTYDWDTQRQALWLYNNQAIIDQSLWNQRMQNYAVAAQIAQLQAQGVARNPNYIDPSYSANPQYMYDTAYVQAAYNDDGSDQVQSVPTSHRGIWIFFSTIFVVLILAVIVWAIFIRQDDSYNYR